VWKLIKDMLFALLAYCREKQEQQAQEKQRRQDRLMARDREITTEVEHERLTAEENLEKAGRSARSYRSAFGRVRSLQ
jgi:hypothetical protein